MRKTPLVLAALLLTQLACATLLAPRPKAEWDTRPEALIVRSSSCCGLVPNTFVENYIPEAQLWGDGRLVWVQHLSSGERRVLTAGLTPAEIEALLQDIVDAGFFGWNDNYADYSVTDMPSTCLQVHTLSASHSVCEYYRGAPRAFHRLIGDLGNGLGRTGVDFVPERGYLTAYPHHTNQGVSANWQWPAEAVGFSLAEAENGRWIDGAALELAWSITNANSWNTLVQDGVNYYEVTVLVPEVSWVTPPAP